MRRNDMKPANVSVIMPMLNARKYLPVTLPAVLKACGHYGATELIIVDNGSSDGSVEYVRQYAGDAAKILARPDLTVAAARNAGAREANGEFLSFIDVDCEISPGYFDEALGVLSETDAAATGSRCVLPPRPHWTEAVWDCIHRRRGDGFVDALNGGNLFIRASAFWAVNGFRETLVSGEDPDLCKRIREAGFAIYEDHRVRAVHHGNPKSLSGFFRKEIWRGFGMISNGGVTDKPAIMTLAHLCASVVGVVIIALPRVAVAESLILATVLQLFVPGASVAYRAVLNGKTRRPVAAFLLYWAYYHARIAGLFLNLLSRLTTRIPDVGRLAWKTASKG